MDITEVCKLFLFLPINIMRLTIKINRFIAFILFIVKRNKFYNIPAINRNIYALFCLCLKRRFCIVSKPVFYKLDIAILQYRFVLAAVWVLAAPLLPIIYIHIPPRRLALALPAPACFLYFSYSARAPSIAVMAFSCKETLSRIAAFMPSMEA